MENKGWLHQDAVQAACCQEDYPAMLQTEISINNGENTKIEMGTW